MPPLAGDPLPAELTYRLRPGEAVLWWSRPQGLALRPRDVAMLPVLAIVAAATLVIVLVPGPTWHWWVKTIFRLAFGFSAISLSATVLTIVVRQRRQQIYAITRGRALRVGGFWAGGFGSWPLGQVADVRVEPGRGAGQGSIWFAVSAAPSADAVSPPAEPEPARPRFERIAAVTTVSGILENAARSARGDAPDPRPDASHA